MDINKLKQIEKRAQIISAIEKGTEFGGDIWQTGLKGRQIFQITQILIDVKVDRFILRANSLVNVDETAPIFIRLCYRNVIFRLDPDNYNVMGDKLVCEWPEEAHALDPRRTDRYVLPFEQNISLSLKRVERSIRDIPQDIELRIIDFSEKGFGILISAVNRDFLKSFDHFWLKAIDQRNLRDEIFGRVTYVSPKGYYLKRGDVRVGLSLDSSISQDIFESLKKKCKKVLTA